MLRELRSAAAACGATEEESMRRLLRAACARGENGWKPRKGDALQLARCNSVHTPALRALDGEWSGVARAMREGGQAACIALRDRANQLHHPPECPMFYGGHRL